ncbi:hypothetical protein [Leucobacter sp.]
MSASFDAESPHRAALRVVVSRLEAVEVELRAAEAERLRPLAEALDLAAAENERRISATPSGARGEPAYRAVHAEIASALHRSEGRPSG